MEPPELRSLLPPHRLMMPKSPGPGAIKTLPWRYSPAASEAPPVPERGRKSKPLPTENNEAAIGETPAGSGEAGSKRSKPDPAISIWGHILPRHAHCQLSVSAREQAHTFAAEGIPETPVPWGGGPSRVPRSSQTSPHPCEATSPAVYMDLHPRFHLGGKRFGCKE